MGKLHILEEVMSTNKISNSDKDLLVLNGLPVGITEYHSLKIEREDSGAIHVQSTSGPLFAKQ